LRTTHIEPDRLYTTREAAEILRVTEQTVQRYLRTRDVLGKQLGPKKKWHVPGKELTRVMKKWGYL